MAHTKTTKVRKPTGIKIVAHRSIISNVKQNTKDRFQALRINPFLLNRPSNIKRIKIIWIKSVKNLTVIARKFSIIISIPPKFYNLII